MENEPRRIVDAIPGFVWTAAPDGSVDSFNQRREDHYRLIADSIPALIAFMSPAGEVESVNRHLLEYFGETLEELKTWATSEFVHPG